ncbi:type III-A CRISPR-associated protein Csm2 [Thermovibrio sp.]
MARRKVSFTKVRKYYQAYLKVYREGLGKDDSEELSSEHLVKLGLLRIRVLFDKNRERGWKAEGLELFLRFITELVNRVNSYKELRMGKEFFEAFISYAKGKLKEKD